MSRRDRVEALIALATWALLIAAAAVGFRTRRS